MSTESEKTEQRLTPRQERALRLLASGCTMKTAAKRVGVNERTVRRWRESRTFDAALSAASHRLHEEAFEFLRSRSLAAARTIDRLRRCAAHESVRLRAAAYEIEAPWAEAIRDIQGRLEIVEERQVEDAYDPRH